MWIEGRVEPTLRPANPLISITAVGIRGSDVRYFQCGRIAGNVVEAPGVLGHESAGVDFSVTPTALEPRPGIRVAIEPRRPCGHRRWGNCWHDLDEDDGPKLSTRPGKPELHHAYQATLHGRAGARYGSPSGSGEA